VAMLRVAMMAVAVPVAGIVAVVVRVMVVRHGAPAGERPRRVQVRAGAAALSRAGLHGSVAACSPIPCWPPFPG
jgi:hypothetical protein